MTADHTPERLSQEALDAIADERDEAQLNTMRAKAETAEWVDAYNAELVKRKAAERDLAALRAECDVLREQTARVEAAFAGIRCALLHWQPDGVTKAVSCANCQSWAANIAMPFYRAALHPDHERTSG